MPFYISPFFDTTLSFYNNKIVFGNNLEIFASTKHFSYFRFIETAPQLVFIRII